jgi:hypothetical protein
VTDHVGDDRAAARPGLDDLLLIGRVQDVDLLEEVVVDERALLQEPVTKTVDVYYKARDEFAKASNLPLATELQRAQATKAFNETQQGKELYSAYVNASAPTVTVN